MNLSRIYDARSFIQRDVEQILRTSCGPFVLDEVAATENRNVKILDFDDDPPFVSRIEFHTRSACGGIDSARRHAKRHDHARREKPCERQLIQGSAKFDQRRPDACSVVRRAPYPHVTVARRARMTVPGARTRRRPGIQPCCFRTRTICLGSRDSARLSSMKAHASRVSCQTHAMRSAIERRPQSSPCADATAPDQPNDFSGDDSGATAR